MWVRVGIDMGWSISRDELLATANFSALRLMTKASEERTSHSRLWTLKSTKRVTRLLWSVLGRRSMHEEVKNEGIIVDGDHKQHKSNDWREKVEVSTTWAEVRYWKSTLQVTTNWRTKAETQSMLQFGLRTLVRMMSTWWFCECAKRQDKDDRKRSVMV